MKSSRTIWLIADDYGLSPGVSLAIRKLAEVGRLSGTGCMTVFDDWKESARLLKALRQPSAIGIHLTLTDFPAVSTGRRMPGLKRLIADIARKTLEGEAIARELDAQADRFIAEMGAPPAFADGHQHVHFLPPVRRWLVRRFGSLKAEERPWLRGAPTLAGAPPGLAPKIAFIRGLATGFDRWSREEGFPVRGPLAGFYDWRSTGRFGAAMSRLVPKLADGAVVMCHPGHVDELLRARDSLTDAREEEFSFLSADAFLALLDRTGLELAREARP